MKIIRTGILIFFFIRTFSMAYSQAPFYKTYDWDPSPKLHVLSAADRKIPELDLKDLHVVEYRLENNQLMSYTLIHMIVRVDNDKAIEKNNRIYLPLSKDAKMIVDKARVINSKGEVKVLKASDIKEGINDDTKTPYQYFALDGVDKGSEIEYLLVIEQTAEVDGKSFILQDETPKRGVAFLIISPGHLVFKTKTYNGLPAFKDSTSRDGRNILVSRIDSIPGLTPEEFAVYKPNLMQAVVKLDENKLTDRTNLINYTEASESIYEMLHERQDKATVKSLKKLIKEIKVNGKTEAESIRKVENYIKMNFLVTQTSDFKTLPAILKNKSTDELGITKLFTTIFDALNINYQVVLTTNRYNLRFDPAFEAYNFLDTYLLYFPDLDQYLCPGSLTYRLNCIPYALTNNFGLFISSVTDGPYTGGIGEIKFIKPSDYKTNRLNHTMKVDFSKSIAAPEIDCTILFDGDYAQSVQPYYSYIPDKAQTELNNNILQNTLKDVAFYDISVENKGAENLGVKPLIIHAKCNPANIVEQAGDNYLFKIGELIGPQVELYQDETRKFNIENDFNRSYTRKISFDIPDGYSVKNLKALKMKAVLTYNNEPSSYFISNYSIENKNTVVVTINEDYKKLTYPKSFYPEFRKVVNASADFNKVVLVFEKKEG